MDKDIKTLGIVVRTSDYKENDKMVTLLTKDYGKLDVSMRGCKKQGASLGAASAQLCYGDFLLYNASGRISVNSCDIKHSFYNLSSDVGKFGAATFITEVACDIATPMEEHGALFALVINLLSFLESGQLNEKQALFCFSIKICDIFGVRPILSECSMCGEANPIKGFSIAQGGVVCAECARYERVNAISAEHLRDILWVLGMKNSGLSGLAHMDDYELRLMLKYMMVNLSISPKRLEFLRKINIVK